MRRTSFGEVMRVDEMPDDVEDGVLYIWRWNDDETIGAAGFRCPCGCGRAVYIPFRAGPKEPHYWSFRQDLDKITLSPSILDRGCGAHYFIEANHVRFC